MVKEPQQENLPAMADTAKLVVRDEDLVWWFTGEESLVKFLTRWLDDGKTLVR
jgi:hypothetical protein